MEDNVGDRQDLEALLCDRADVTAGHLQVRVVKVIPEHQQEGLVAYPVFRTVAGMAEAILGVLDNEGDPLSEVQDVLEEDPSAAPSSVCAQGHSPIHSRGTPRAGPRQLQWKPPSACSQQIVW